MAAAILAKRRGLTVLSTTRNPAKARRCAAIGVDHVLIDDGDVADAGARDPAPDGVDAALELRRHPHPARHAARDRRARRGLLHRDAVQPVDRARLLPDRLPPRGRPADRLRRRRQRPARAAVLQEFLDAVGRRQRTRAHRRVYGFDEIVEAHADMEGEPARAANSSSLSRPADRFSISRSRTAREITSEG